MAAGKPGGRPPEKDAFARVSYDGRAIQSWRFLELPSAIRDHHQSMREGTTKLLSTLRQISSRDMEAHSVFARADEAMHRRNALGKKLQLEQRWQDLSDRAPLDIGDEEVRRLRDTQSHLVDILDEFEDSKSDLFHRTSELRKTVRKLTEHRNILFSRALSGGVTAPAFEEQYERLRTETRTWSEQVARLRNDRNKYIREGERMNLKIDQWWVDLRGYLATWSRDAKDPDLSGWRDTMERLISDAESSDRAIAEVNDRIIDAFQEDDELATECSVFFNTQDDLFSEFVRYYAALEQYVRAQLTLDEVARSALTAETDQRIWCCESETCAGVHKKGKHQLIVGIAFELLCTDLLEQMDVQVQWSGPDDEDGIDHRGEAEGRLGIANRLYVQAKYKGASGQVTTKEVREFSGAANDLGHDSYDRAVFMTLGRIHEKAPQPTPTNKLEYRDGCWMLREMLLHEVGMRLNFQLPKVLVEFDDGYWDNLLRRARESFVANRQQPAVAN